MLVATLFIILKIWKPPKHISEGEWINKSSSTTLPSNKKELTANPCENMDKSQEQNV